MSDLIGKTKISRLEQRALREGWAIPPEDKQAIVARQVEIATNASSPRQATSATRCLLTMNGQDLRQAAEEAVEQPPAPLHFDAGERRIVAEDGVERRPERLDPRTVSAPVMRLLTDDVL